jgi:hypothetical protein
VAGTAGAEVACGDHQDIAKRLASEYGEVRHGAGLVDSGRIIEIFVSPKQGSWTILVTHSEGPTCVVAAGEAWENIPLRSFKSEISS